MLQTRIWVEGFEPLNALRSLPAFLKPLSQLRSPPSVKCLDSAGTFWRVNVLPWQTHRPKTAFIQVGRAKLPLPICFLGGGTGLVCVSWAPSWKDGVIVKGNVWEWTGNRPQHLFSRSKVAAESCKSSSRFPPHLWSRVKLVWQTKPVGRSCPYVVLQTFQSVASPCPLFFGAC
jgi:hypothetical protein